MRRALIFVLVILAGGLLFLSFQEPEPTPSPAPSSGGTVAPFTGPLAAYEDESLSFSYPAHWRRASFDINSSQVQLIVYFSTEPLTDPCRRDATAIACEGAPISGLGPDGVLVSWWRGGMPGWKLDESIEQITTIDGRRATIQQQEASAMCTSIGGEEELQVQIEQPQAAGNFFEVDTCVRGPSINATGAEIAAMLASVLWKH